MATVERLKTAADWQREVDGWKSVAVIAAIPLEAMRMSGGYRVLSPAVQQGVDEAVVTIRMAIAGEMLPPKGNIDVALQPTRDVLNSAYQEP